MKFFRRRKSDACNGSESTLGHWHFSRGLKWGAGIFAAGATFAAVMAVVMLVGLPWLQRQPTVTEADVPGLCGWAGKEEADAAWAKLAPRFAKFQIMGAAQDNAKARAVLWDAAKLVNGGKHLPTFRQVIGDCVGAGAKQAMDYLQCVEAIRTGAVEFKPIYSPYHYACGRMAPDLGAGKIRGPDGSVGSWQAEALVRYGVLPADLPGLEPYSGPVIRKWAVRMPAAQWVEHGRQYLVRSAAQVKTADEVRDAVCNGYPVTIASDVGFQMRPGTKDGRLVNRRSGSWAHQMSVIGYDGATGSEPYWYILNSWGEDAHGNPPDDAPPGGFWVTRRDMDTIVRQGDSFALSQFEGFKSQEWIIISRLWKSETPKRAGAIVRAAVLASDANEVAWRAAEQRRAIEDRFDQVAHVEDN